MATSSKPFYRVARAFQTTYHMTKYQRCIHHLIICLSCGHWREIQHRANSQEILGRLFSCGESH